MSGKSNIGYGFSKSNEGSFFTFNCAENRKNQEVFFRASEEDVQKAAELALAAFSIYENTSGILRSTFLKGIANALDQQRDELIRCYVKESSLSAERGQRELDRTIFQLETFAGIAAADKWFNRIEFEDSGLGLRLHSVYQAIGPVVVFGASNFPFAYSTVGGDTAAALAVGCPVIVKAHPMHAGTSEKVASIVLDVAKELGLPDGVFSHLFDDGHEIGTQLVAHPAIRAVGFTGSIKGGRALMDLAAKRAQPIPVFAEMGSLNPVLFFEEELKDRMDVWVEQYVHSIATDAGQFCTKPGLLFVPLGEIGDVFTDRLKHELACVAPTCHLHPHLFETFKSQVSTCFEWEDTGLPFHSQPTLRVVDSQKFIENPSFREEFFGPQSIVIRYADLSELRKLLEKLDGQLTTTFIANDDEMRAVWELVVVMRRRAGRLIRNGVPTGVSVSDAMVHGGAYPASSDSRFTAVGGQSVYRFVRPVSYQNF